MPRLQIILPSTTHAEEQAKSSKQNSSMRKKELTKIPFCPENIHPIPNVHSSNIDCSHRYRPSGGKWIGVRRFCFFCFSSLPKKANGLLRLGRAISHISERGVLCPQGTRNDGWLGHQKRWSDYSNGQILINGDESWGYCHKRCRILLALNYCLFVLIGG